MTAPLLEAVDLTKRFGGVSAVDRVSFAAAPQEITTVIGPNGAGKTTLFNLITGFVSPTSGDVIYRGQRITGMPAPQVAGAGIIRTFQNPIIFNETTVVENVMVGCHRWTRTGFIQAALALPAAVREDRTVRETAMAALALVGLEGRAHDRARDLPFGQQRLLEVARALVARPALLLLDEPTAGLSAQEAQHLVALIRRLRARRNVRLVQPQTSSHELIRRSQAVAVISSTVGLEALLYEKPVLTLGQPYYSGYGATLDLDSFTQVREQVPELLRFRPDPELIRRLLHAAMRECLPGAPVLVDRSDENAVALAGSIEQVATRAADARAGAPAPVSA